MDYVQYHLRDWQHGVCTGVSRSNLTKTYTKDTTKKVMKTLRELGMITTRRAPGGVLITVCNYDFYQNPQNYESTNDNTNESTMKAPLKHHDDLYNNKKKKNKKSFPPNSSEIRLSKLLYENNQEEKMKQTITKEIYKFEELPEDIKEKVIENFRNDTEEDQFWSQINHDEIGGSLFALIKEAGIEIKDYSLGYDRGTYLHVNMDENIEDFSGKRAFAWIENNLLSNLRIPWKGPKRWELAKYGAFYRPGLIKPCPFTGMCYDEDFLKDLIDNIKSGMTLKDSFEALETTYSKIFYAEWEGRQSEEYIIETIEANEYEFDGEGNLV